MKLITYSLPFLLILLLACSGKGDKSLPAKIVDNPASAEGQSGKGSLPEITFTKLDHDFGRVSEGETVTYSFRFRNTGKSDLIISNVSTTCGCAVSDYPRDPVKKGEENTVSVTFKSEGKPGFQNKTITVMTNTQPNSTTLSIKAQVIPHGKN